jgi:HSP20 family protein
MNSLVTQDPWSFVPRLQTEINRLFGNANQSDSSSATATWVPAVDIHEYTDRFELYVDVPGIDPGKVELTLEGGILTLSGQRTAPEFSKPDEKPQYARSERGLGHFYRRFVLPDTVDSEKVNANGKDGVLTITIAKQAKAMPRRIRIGA